MSNIKNLNGSYLETPQDRFNDRMACIGVGDLNSFERSIEIVSLFAETGGLPIKESGMTLGVLHSIKGFIEKNIVENNK